ncbi:hypothetical protein M404DRAFT_894317 [Pisolithus tinctorius Marx 270]|uniref:Uncharacterized protein n=1 Tax=Pisolithus tinctorius Marx 270 TaxID=870435 RepID=A0A0C3NQ63_PISTI|nr:hypothetical protein M404DRAFT_894317 [Pisolithus tinctorius Marx 270]
MSALQRLSALTSLYKDRWVLLLVNSAMWDMRGNNPPNSPRSPYPHFPVPFPRAPPEMSESRSAYQKSYMPFGTPIAQPARMHNTK